MFGGSAIAKSQQSQQKHEQDSKSPDKEAKTPENEFDAEVTPAAAFDRIQADSPAQPRPEEVLVLQRSTGNAAVQKIIQSRQDGANSAGINQPNPSAGENESTAALQRQPGEHVIQRSVTLERQIITSYEQALAFVTLRNLRLLDQQAEFNREGTAPPAALAEGITHSQAMITWLNSSSDREGEIDNMTALMMQSWYEQYIESFNASEAAKARAARERLETAENRLQALDDSISESIIPGLREMQRSAFRSDESSTLLSIADTLATALDTALGCREAIELIAGERAALGTFANTALVMSGESPLANNRAAGVLNILERINQAYAAFQLLRAGLSLLEGSRTEAESGLGAVSAATTAYGAAGTLLGVSAGVSAYANLYLGPAVSATLSAVSRMFDVVSRTENRQKIEAGMFDIVAWDLEPGGRAMFDFMLQVMRAGSSGDIPTPVPEMVADYFVDNESAFEAGAGEGEDLPTTGWWFWESLDQSRIARWVFANRDSLWGMLYGATQVPTVVL